MKTRIIEKYGHWKIKNPLLELITTCRATETTRYSIEHVYIDNDVVVVTDGRRLLKVSVKHDIPNGLYPITVDGYILAEVTDAIFPKHEDVIPRKEEMLQIVSVSESVDINGLILGSLVNAGCIVDVDLYLPPLKALGKLRPYSVNVWVYKDDPGRPFLLECETDIEQVVYVQIPVHVKNNLGG